MSSSLVPDLYAETSIQVIESLKIDPSSTKVVDVKSSYEHVPLAGRKFTFASFKKFILCSPEVKSAHIIKSTFHSYPYFLSGLRLTFAVYMLSVDVSFFSTTQVNPSMTFFYLTNLGYLSLFTYFLLAGVTSLIYQWRYRSLSKKERIALLNRTGPLWTLIQFLYTFNFPIHFIITVVYWIIIHHEVMKTMDLLPHEVWMNYSVHAVTLFMMFLEFLLNQQRIYLYHMIHLTVFNCIYLGWTWVGTWINSTETETWYVYYFLDWSEQPAYLYYIGSFVAILFCYFIILVIHWIKYTLFPGQHPIVKGRVSDSQHTNHFLRSIVFNPEEDTALSLTIIPKGTQTMTYYKPSDGNPISLPT